MERWDFDYAPIPDDSLDSLDQLVAASYPRFTRVMNAFFLVTQLAVVVLFALFALICLVVGQYLGAVICAALVVAGIWSVRYARKHGWYALQYRHYRPDAVDLPPNVHVEADESALTFISRYGRSRLEWSRVRKVETTQDFVMLLDAVRRGWAIPTRAFSNLADRDAFVAFARRCAGLGDAGSPDGTSPDDRVDGITRDTVHEEVDTG